MSELPFRKIYQKAIYQCNFVHQLSTYLFSPTLSSSAHFSSIPFLSTLSSSTLYSSTLHPSTLFSSTLFSSTLFSSTLFSSTVISVIISLLNFLLLKENTKWEKVLQGMSMFHHLLQGATRYCKIGQSGVTRYYNALQVPQKCQSRKIWDFQAWL